MAVLSVDEIRAGVAGLGSWDLVDGSVVAEFGFDDFRQAVAFVVRVSFEAESANHHPDIDVRYNRVRLALSTHSAGGVTDKDLALAAVIQGLTDH